MSIPVWQIPNVDPDYAMACERENDVREREARERDLAIDELTVDQMLKWA